VHLSGIERHFARHLTDDQARTLAEIMDRVRASAAETPTLPAEP
jgi:hypothetical protein